MSFPAENLPVAPSHYTYSKNPRPLSQPPGLRPLSRDPICAVKSPLLGRAQLDPLEEHHTWKVPQLFTWGWGGVFLQKAFSLQFLHELPTHFFRDLSPDRDSGCHWPSFADHLPHPPHEAHLPVHLGIPRAQSRCLANTGE